MKISFSIYNKYIKYEKLKKTNINIFLINRRKIIYLFAPSTCLPILVTKNLSALANKYACNSLYTRY